MKINFFDIATTFKPERGDLLISEPYLPDPNFERSVIYLCEHDQNGSLGYILNKPTTILFSDVIDEFEGFNPKINLGGPVEQGTLHFLHKDFINLNSGKQVHDGIYWGGDFNKITTNATLKLLDESNYKFFIGYSGWSSGQLNDEIAARSWIVFKKAPLDIIFDAPIDTMWSDVLKKMGGRYKMFANYPIDPSLN